MIHVHKLFMSAERCRWTLLCEYVFRKHTKKTSLFRYSLPHHDETKKKNLQNQVFLLFLMKICCVNEGSVTGGGVAFATFQKFRPARRALRRRASDASAAAAARN